MRVALPFMAGVLGMLAVASPALSSDCSSPDIPGGYDLVLKNAARQFLPAPYKAHWCILKAQCWVESNLRPDATSPVGAAGLCQIMPATEVDIAERFALGHGNIRDAKYNARVGAATMRFMLLFWAWERSAECRLELAWASYNGGPGNIQQAQKESGMRLCWDSISPHLHKVTGHHSAETIAYVSRVWSTWRKLKGYSIL